MFLLRVARACAPALLVLPLAAGCGTKIEDQTAFKEQTDRLVRMQEDLDALQRRLSVVDRDLQAVTLDVSKVNREGAGANSEVMATLNTRLSKIEQQLTTLTEGRRTVQDRIARLESGDGQAVAAVAAADPGPLAQPSSGSARPARLIAMKKVEPASEVRTTPAVKTTSVAKKTAAEAVKKAEARPPEPAKPMGFYHMVSEGETLTQIARNYHVSLPVLARENRIPVERQVVAGQQIYVPASTD